MRSAGWGARQTNPPPRCEGGNMDFMTAQGKRQPLNELLHAHLLTLHVTNKLKVIQFFSCRADWVKAPAGICCHSQKERCLFAFSRSLPREGRRLDAAFSELKSFWSRTLELGAPADWSFGCFRAWCYFQVRIIWPWAECLQRFAGAHAGAHAGRCFWCRKVLFSKSFHPNTSIFCCSQNFL